MATTTRFLTSGTGALFVTTALFFVMYQMIQNPRQAPVESSDTPQFEFRQLIPETTPPPRDDFVKPEPVKPEPRLPTPTNTDVYKPIEPSTNLEPVTISGFTFGPGGFGLPPGPGNGGQWGSGGGHSLVPLVRIQPPYPRHAALAGIEGWVEVSFTVTETGSVVNPRIENASPAGYFENAVRAAIVKWRFQPQTVDGRPVRVRVTQTIEFSLKDK